MLGFLCLEEGRDPVDLGVVVLEALADLVLLVSRTGHSTDKPALPGLFVRWRGSEDRYD